MLNFFGTDGIRGRVGTGLFVQQQLITLGQSIALWAQKKYASNPHIMIAHDTRISSAFVKAALKTGLLQFPTTIRDVYTLPTPALAHLMKTRSDIDCAVMISASHNSYEDNGIKIIDAHTGKLSPLDEHTISSYIADMPPATSIFGTDLPIQDAVSTYCAQICALFPTQFLAGKIIVLDTAHGATYQVAPRIFEQLGAQVIAINHQPDGYNINHNCGTLHPKQLMQAVKQHAADVGFAFDGDGDRVVAVNRHGLLKDGDDLLALLLNHPTYAQTNCIVGTNMTNEGLTHHLKQQDKQLIRTAVGDKYISEKLTSDQLLLGGEPSGHIILNDIINTGDGILVALRVMEALFATNNWDMETFEHFPQAIINVPVAFRKNLDESPFQNIITMAQEHLANGRILVRYSGTENVLRIMVEADSYNFAHATCQQLADELSKAL